MKVSALVTWLAIFSISCTQKAHESETDLAVERTKKVVLAAYEAQVSGNLEIWKSLISDVFEYTLNGQLDISKSYNWDEFMIMQAKFGKLLRGPVSAEFKDIVCDVDKAVVFADGKMAGVGGKYENEYALKYELNNEGRITHIKEWLSDILFATQMYGQEIDAVPSEATPSL